MTTQVQLRRGTTAQHATFTGAVGEVTVDTDKEVVVVHDGAAAGGYPMARQSLSNVPNGSVTTALIADGAITAAKLQTPAATVGFTIAMS